MPASSFVDPSGEDLRLHAAGTRYTDQGSTTQPQSQGTWQTPSQLSHSGLHLVADQSHEA